MVTTGDYCIVFADRFKLGYFFKCLGNLMYSSFCFLLDYKNLRLLFFHEWLRLIILNYNKMNELNFPLVPLNPKFSKIGNITVLQQKSNLIVISAVINLI